MRSLAACVSGCGKPGQAVNVVDRVSADTDDVEHGASICKCKVESAKWKVSWEVGKSDKCGRVPATSNAAWVGSREALGPARTRNLRLSVRPFATVPSASVNVLHGTGLPCTGATVATSSFIRCT